jgi:hypothetical protein
MALGHTIQQCPTRCGVKNTLEMSVYSEDYNFTILLFSDVLSADNVIWYLIRYEVDQNGDKARNNFGGNGCRLVCDDNVIESARRD